MLRRITLTRAADPDVPLKRRAAHADDRLVRADREVTAQVAGHVDHARRGAARVRIERRGRRDHDGRSVAASGRAVLAQRVHRRPADERARRRRRHAAAATAASARARSAACFSACTCTTRACTALAAGAGSALTAAAAPALPAVPPLPASAWASPTLTTCSGAARAGYAAVAAQSGAARRGPPARSARPRRCPGASRRGSALARCAARRAAERTARCRTARAAG